MAYAAITLIGPNHRAGLALSRCERQPQTLLHARHRTEMMRLHGDFVQAQMRSLAEQAGEMGRIFGRAAMDRRQTKTLKCPNTENQP